MSRLHSLAVPHFLTFCTARCKFCPAQCYYMAYAPARATRQAGHKVVLIPYARNEDVDKLLQNLYVSACNITVKFSKTKTSHRLSFPPKNACQHNLTLTSSLMLTTQHIR